MPEDVNAVNLSGKTAIVTGASRGVGKAISLALAQAGANVVVVARTVDDSNTLSGTIHQTVTEIENLGGVALPVRCDVTGEDEVRKMVETVVNSYGTIDILVNNAGIFRPLNFMETTMTDFLDTFLINVQSPFICTQAVLPLMLAQKSGSIINVSSSLAESEHPVYSAYAGSKAALNRMMIKLASEVAEANIAVNVLKPGGMSSEGMIAIATDEALSRMPSPETMGPPTVWLAAQDAGSYTGKLVAPIDFGTKWP